MWAFGPLEDAKKAQNFTGYVGHYSKRLDTYYVYGGDMAVTPTELSKNATNVTKTGASQLTLALATVISALLLF